MLTKAQFRKLKREIVPQDTAERRREYIGHGFSPAVYRWDCLTRAGIEDWLKREVKASDPEIDEALRRIVRDLY